MAGNLNKTINVLLLIFHIWILQTIVTASYLALSYKAYQVQETRGTVAKYVEIWHILAKVIFVLVFLSIILMIPQWWRIESKWWHKILTFPLLCTKTWPHYRLARLIFFYATKNKEKASEEESILKQNVSFNGDGILQYHLLLVPLVFNYWNEGINFGSYLDPKYGDILFLVPFCSSLTAVVFGITRFVCQGPAGLNSNDQNNYKKFMNYIFTFLISSAYLFGKSYWLAVGIYDSNADKSRMKMILGLWIVCSMGFQSILAIIPIFIQFRLKTFGLLVQHPCLIIVPLFSPFVFSGRRKVDDTMKTLKVGQKLSLINLVLSWILVVVGHWYFVYKVVPANFYKGLDGSDETSQVFKKTIGISSGLMGFALISLLFIFFIDKCCKSKKSTETKSTMELHNL